MKPKKRGRGLQVVSLKKRREIAAMGGAASTSRGFRDPQKARRAVLIRWARWRKRA